MANHPDVLILGGGVIGLSTALFLRKQNVQVDVIDKGDLGQESSWAGAGIISPAPETHLARSPLEKLHALSVRLLSRLSHEFRESLSIDNGYLACGGLVLLEPNEEDAAVRLWKQSDITFEEMDERKLHQFEPALADRLTAYCMPETGPVRNLRPAKAPLAWCGTHGVGLRPGCPAFGFERQGAKITAVRTANGSVSAGRVLLTAGAWTDQLLEPLGVKLGVRPVRGQIALLSTPTPLLNRVVEQGSR